MYRYVLLLMIIIPAVEIGGIVMVGQWLGAGPTFALILLSAIAGALLVKKEAGRIWLDVRSQLQSGQLPAMRMLDGICVFAGGLLLLSPGFVTDIFGLLLVLPPTRWLFRGWLIVLLRKYFMRGGSRIFFRRW